MADYKTAEQYVVERLEILERELEAKDEKYKTSLGHLEKSLAAVHIDLKDVCRILDMLRDYISIYDSEIGRYITIDSIGRHESPELFNALVEYFDLEVGDQNEC